jgi:hypothetical protein
MGALMHGGPNYQALKDVLHIVKEIYHEAKEAGEHFLDNDEIRWTDDRMEAEHARPWNYCRIGQRPRAPIHRIATALGIETEEFRAWTGSLVATRELDANALLYSAPLPTAAPRCHRERATPKIVADRVFEAAGGGAHIDGLEGED